MSGVVFCDFAEELEEIREFLELHPELPAIDLAPYARMVDPHQFVDGHYSVASNADLSPIIRQKYFNRLRQYVQQVKQRQATAGAPAVLQGAEIAA